MAGRLSMSRAPSSDRLSEPSNSWSISSAKMWALWSSESFSLAEKIFMKEEVDEKDI